MNFLNLFLPPRCPVCTKIQEDSKICYQCFSQISFLSNACAICQEPFDYVVHGIDTCLNCQKKKEKYEIRNKKYPIDGMKCALIYNETIKNLILRFKNGSDFSLLDIFATWIINSAQEQLKGCIIVPVPLNKWRLLRRGYNQAQLLAKKITQKTGIVHMNLLNRVKHTASQGFKTFKQRAENIKGAFEVADFEFVKNSNIFLLDDVITTGSTILECAKTLKKGGAGKVYAISLARRIKNTNQLYTFFAIFLNFIVN